MNYIDFIIVIPVVWGAWKGFRSGLIIEICTLLALILGVWGGIHFSDAVAGFLNDTFNTNSEYLPVIAFTLTFLAVGAMVYFAGKMIEKGINLAALKPFNKMAGLLFGAAKFLFFVSTFLVILEGYDEKSTFLPTEMKEESALYKPVTEFSTTTIPALKNSDMFIKTGKLIYDNKEYLEENLLKSDSIKVES